MEKENITNYTKEQLEQILYLILEKKEFNDILIELQKEGKIIEFNINNKRYFKKISEV